MALARSFHVTADSAGRPRRAFRRPLRRAPGRRLGRASLGRSLLQRVLLRNLLDARDAEVEHHRNKRRAPHFGEHAGGLGLEGKHDVRRRAGWQRAHALRRTPRLGADSAARASCRRRFAWADCGSTSCRAPPTLSAKTARVWTWKMMVNSAHCHSGLTMPLPTRTPPRKVGRAIWKVPQHMPHRSKAGLGMEARRTSAQKPWL